MPFELRFADGRAPMRAGKIVGVGKNYAEHVREMAGSPFEPANQAAKAAGGEPILFLKPSTSFVADGGHIVLPRGVGLVHHELELAVVIGAAARRVEAASALAHVAGYAVMLDVTARDLQNAAKKAGNPWAVAKGLDSFAPISRVRPRDEAPAWDAVVLELRVNGGVRQAGATKEMLVGVPDLIALVSRKFTLEPGDVIATGTPAGVGPIVAGDRLEASASGIGSLRVDAIEGEPL
ncbi:MAG: fumarylacetoacetate hydrolase family protein [Thermoplasmatota archaeon]